MSQTLSKPRRLVSVGDTVIWFPGSYDARMAEVADDTRFGWIGLITHVIKPEINLNNDEITIIEAL